VGDKADVANDDVVAAAAAAVAVAVVA